MELNSIQDDSIDVVASNYVLMDLPILYDAVNSIYRVLKNGGKAVLIFGHPCFDQCNGEKYPYFIERKCYEEWGNFTIPFPFFHRPLSTYWKTFKKRGFKIDDFDDLLPLKSIIGDARIVALGEGTHGTKEFFKMKHRVIEFLAKEMGFTVFAIEANMPEARLVNKYVLSGAGNSKTALAGIYFWTWNTQEVLDMIEWMYHFNKSGDGHIEFFGFDMQIPHVALDSLISFVHSSGSSQKDSLLYYCHEINSAIDSVGRIAKYKISSEKDLDVFKGFCAQWRRSANRVIGLLQNNRVFYLQSVEEKEFEWAIQNAQILLQTAQMNWPQVPSRDESMAKNIDWILEQHPPGTKIILWAHNIHVSKKEGAMGNYLYKKYDEDLITFGFAFCEGKYIARGENGIGIYETSLPEPGSLEWIFHKTGQERFFFDLRRADANSLESSWLYKELDFRIIGARSEAYISHTNWSTIT